MIFFGIALSLATFFIIFYRAELITAYAWLLLLAFITVPVTLLGLIFQLNIAKTADRLESLQDTRIDFIKQYANYRLYKKIIREEEEKEEVKEEIKAEDKKE